MPKVLKRRILDVTNYVIDQLRCEGARIGNKSVTTNSVYIKFTNPGLKSLTIRDHNTKQKYKYKWNLRMDMKGSWMEKDGQVNRYYFGADCIDEMVERIKQYSRKIAQNTKCVYQRSDTMKIIEVDGNLLDFKGYDVMMHQVNCQGVMGAGLARQVRDQFPQTYKRYREICTVENNPKDVFGRCFIGREKDVEIINLFGQFSYGLGKQTDYFRLGQALGVAATYCKEREIKSIGVPKNMGSALAGGDWKTVLGLIKTAFADVDIDVYIVNYKR